MRVKVLFEPTLASANAQLTVPVTEKLSPFAKPEYWGVPVTLTVVVLSQFLSAALRPVMVSPLAVTVLEAVATLTLLAPVLERTIFPE